MCQAEDDRTYSGVESRPLGSQAQQYRTWLVGSRCGSGDLDTQGIREAGLGVVLVPGRDDDHERGLEKLVTGLQRR